MVGTRQMATTKVLGIQQQANRIAQARHIRITVLGNDSLPMQVDGEAWLQPPGEMIIEHQNHVPMLCRDKVGVHTSYCPVQRFRQSDLMASRSSSELFSVCPQNKIGSTVALHDLVLHTDRSALVSLEAFLLDPPLALHFRWNSTLHGSLFFSFLQSYLADLRRWQREGVAKLASLSKETVPTAYIEALRPLETKVKDLIARFVLLKFPLQSFSNSHLCHSKGCVFVCVCQ